MLNKIIQPKENLLKIKNPVFIVGCGHSGTSILLKILGYHTSLYSIPYETEVFYKDKKDLIREVRQFETKCLSEKKIRYIEKTPRHIYKIEKILQLFPESRILLMLRDGRDVACSIKARTKDFNIGLNRWVDDNCEGYKYWQSNQVLVVKYENLVQNTNATLYRVFNFLEEEYTDKILEYHKKKQKWFGASNLVLPKNMTSIQEHKNLRNWQVNQPIFDGSGRWKKDMNHEEKQIFKAVGQKYLECFGYEKNENW